MESLWHAHRPHIYDEAPTGKSPDILIVGGGFAGVSAAAELAAIGARVLLIEKDRLGGGASGRNAGFLLSGAAEDYLTLSRQSGEAVARLMMDLSFQNRRKVQALGEVTGHDLELDATGSFFLSATPEERDHVQAVGRAMRQAGYGAQEVSPEAAGPGLAAMGYGPGLYYPGDGQIHPVKLIHALAEEAHRHGAEFLEGTPVLEIREESGAFSVHTEARVFRTKTLILALNAYFPTLLPEARDWLEPVRGQVLATSPVPRQVFSGPVYANWGYRYFRQTREGRLIMGGFRDLFLKEEVGRELTLHAGIQERLETEARVLAPEARVEARWSGIMAMTPDKLPFVGEVNQGLWVIGGFSGHGVALAPVLGEHLAHMVSGTRSPYPHLGPDRFSR